MSFSNSKDILGNWKGGMLSLYLDFRFKQSWNNNTTPRPWLLYISADSGDVYTISGYRQMISIYCLKPQVSQKVVFAGAVSVRYVPGLHTMLSYKEFDNTVSGEYGNIQDFNNNIQIIRNGYASNLCVHLRR